MLHGITACDEISRLLPLYMQMHCGCVWSLHTSPGWEILPHERHQCLPRKGGVWRILVPSWWRKSSRPPSKWYKDDGKLKLMACIHLFFIWNCVHKNVLFLLIWTCTSSYCHTKLLSFPIGLLETHEQIDKKIVPPKVIVWCWRWHRWQDSKTDLAVQYNNIIVFISDESSVVVWQDSSSLCDKYHDQRYNIIQINYTAGIFGRLYYICWRFTGWQV